MIRKRKPKILQILPMYHSAGEDILNREADVRRTDQLDTSHLCTMVQEVEGVVLRAPAKMTAEIIAANPHLKVISGAGVGLDNIDVASATEYGIPVLHAPSVNHVSTAEHVMALLLTLTRQIKPFQKKMAQGDFGARDTIVTHELRGKKMGLIGFGQIAREVAKRCRHGFEMDVLAYVRHLDREKQAHADWLDVRLTTDRDELFRTSDFVSVHIPLNDVTRHAIRYEHFAKMKSSAHFINTARGGIVHTESLIAALREGLIAGAGLDVFDPEPPSPDLALLRMPQVVVTPHIGGITEEANYITSTMIAKNVLRVIRGEKPGYVANPGVFRKRLK